MTDSKKDNLSNTETYSVSDTASGYSTSTKTSKASKASKAKSYMLKLRNCLSDPNNPTTAPKRKSSYQSAAQYLALR